MYTPERIIQRQLIVGVPSAAADHFSQPLRHARRQVADLLRRYCAPFIPHRGPQCLQGFESAALQSAFDPRPHMLNAV